MSHLLRMPSQTSRLSFDCLHRPSRAELWRLSGLAKSLYGLFRATARCESPVRNSLLAGNPLSMRCSKRFLHRRGQQLDGMGFRPGKRKSWIR